MITWTKIKATKKSHARHTGTKDGFRYEIIEYRSFYELRGYELATGDCVFAIEVPNIRVAKRYAREHRFYLMFKDRYQGKL